MGHLLIMSLVTRIQELVTNSVTFLLTGDYFRGTVTSAIEAYKWFEITISLSVVGGGRRCVFGSGFVCDLFFFNLKLSYN